MKCLSPQSRSPRLKFRGHGFTVGLWPPLAPKLSTGPYLYDQALFFVTTGCRGSEEGGERMYGVAIENDLM